MRCVVPVQRDGNTVELRAWYEAPFSGPASMALELVPGALAVVTGEVRYAPLFALESARP